MRTVVFHYHLFKNAGTSLDAALKSAFGEERWRQREFGGNPARIRAEVADWVDSEPEAVVFSSHTALLPPPELDGVQVLPLIFVRHPIDRIASAYRFEARQNADTFGSVLARNTSLSGYVETRLALPSDRQCRDFHCHRLAHMALPSTGTELQRARRAVESLPFVGLVEQYGASLARVEQLLRSHDLHPRPLEAMRKNSSEGSHQPLLARLTQVQSELGQDLFDRVVAANESDFEIYNLIKEMYRASPESS